MEDEMQSEVWICVACGSAEVIDGKCQFCGGEVSARYDEW